MLVAIALFSYLYGVVGAKPTPAGRRITPVSNITASVGPESANILFLGTSLTSRGEWTDQLARELRRCHTADVTIHRLAKAGASSRWGVSAFKQFLHEDAGSRIAAVVVEFSANDSSLYRGMPLILSRKYHEVILRLARSRHIPVYLATRNPAWGTKAWVRPGQRRYQALYRDLAPAFSAGLIDTAPDWEGLSSKLREHWLPDGLHPTDEAIERILVPALREALMPIVCTRGTAISTAGKEGSTEPCAH